MWIERQKEKKWYPSVGTAGGFRDGGGNKGGFGNIGN